MRRTSWNVCVLAAAIALAVAWGSRAEDDKDDKHKAEDFKGKTFELKACQNRPPPR